MVNGKGGLFEIWLELRGDETGRLSIARAAARLGLLESTLRSHIHRLRQRYRQLLREEIGRTVAGPGDVDEEMRYFLSLVSELTPPLERHGSESHVDP